MDNSKYVTERGQRPHYLYVVKCGPYFKVGITGDIKVRMRTLNNGTPFSMRLILYRAIKSMHANLSR